MPSRPPVQRTNQLPSLPERPAEAHKGAFGRVLIVAGSLGMSGAACLAGLGALRGGAGLVSLAVPHGIISIVAGFEPSYLTIPLPEDALGRMRLEARDRLTDLMARNTAIGVGPGWGQSDDLRELARWLFTQVDRPLVVDADALNLLAQMPEELSSAPAPRILTPHPGEFARLTGREIGSIQSDRETAAAEFASHHDCLVVLKGQGTVVTDGRRSAINPTGNSGMATGGTGDVLTGLITALLAQGMGPFEAAQLGVYLHGLAGDLAAEQLSQPGLIASDLADFLPQAWLQGHQ